jgi:CheY-like chemotaxis protein
VDDEEAVLEVALAMLETAGFQTLAVTDGPTAVTAFEEHRRDLCCILLDRNLPGMDGLEVYGAIRARDPDLPMVLCSGYPRDAMVEAAVGNRRVPYVTKPFRYADLVGALRDALDGG